MPVSKSKTSDQTVTVSTTVVAPGWEVLQDVSFIVPLLDMFMFCPTTQHTLGLFI